MAQTEDTSSDMPNYYQSNSQYEIYLPSEIYHTVRYQIQYAVNTRLLDFFMVDLDTGRVFVNYTTTDVLDRDGDEPQHRIFFTQIDNLYGEGGKCYHL